MTAKRHTSGDSCHLHGPRAVEGCPTCALRCSTKGTHTDQQLDLLAALAELGVASLWIISEDSSDMHPSANLDDKGRRVEP
jgi:hypothetical protein